MIDLTPEDYRAAAANGISHDRLYQRVYVYGWSKERALTEKIRPRRNLKKWVEIAEKNGISRTRFTNRVACGWDEQRAATEPVWTKADYAKRMRSVKPKRKYSESLIQKAKETGISLNAFYWRISKGWDPERAASTPPRRLNR